MDIKSGLFNLRISFLAEERVLHAYQEIPNEATTIDRLWPTELINKDSRIRRELSAQGRDNFSCKEYEECLGNSVSPL